jgi:hypothetical protein
VRSRQERRAAAVSSATCHRGGRKEAAVERLAFERDAGARERAGNRNLHLALAALVLTLTVTAIAASEPATTTGHAAPRAASEEPALGRPGRRF